MRLNDEQQRAVDLTEGPVILVSCPGSGKTTTLLARINNIIRKGIPPEKILMVTFTKAAADEMAEKYKREYGSPDGILFCTIHALCLRILLTYGGYTADSILKEADAKQFLFSEVKRKRYSRDVGKTVSHFLTQYSAAKNNLIPIGKIEPEGMTKQVFCSLAESYENMKKEYKKIDFDDMLEYALKLMKQDDYVCKALQERWDYIQVDEYQDTNILQRDILYLLSSRHRNLCVAGDDDQSIYRFRGARPEIMLNFTKDFPDAKIVKNSTNYRSMPGIIELANQLIIKNKSRFTKDFLAGREGKSEVCILGFENVDAQLAALCKELKGKENNDVAILYRNNIQAEPIADCFLKEGIPFYTTEKIQDSYDSWIWGDIQAYYRLSKGNGTSHDMLRIIDRPLRYLGNICRNAGEMTKEGMSKEAREQLRDWRLENAEKQIYLFFRHLSLMGRMIPKDFLEYLLNTVRYRDYIAEYFQSTSQDPEAAFQSLRIYAEDAAKFATMEQWLQYVIKRSFLLKKKNMEKEGVLLSTMHRSKGLEWEHVYIIDCNEGVVPGKRTDGDIAALEEERRLFYVAITRAKSKLDIYYTRKRGNKNVSRSRFLEEITDMGDTGNDGAGKKKTPLKRNSMANHRKYGMCMITGINAKGQYMAVTLPGKKEIIGKEEDFS
ncbi:MAG TPA: ATP-dependent helicase [Candidatus Blautia faecavium]|uniref:DNA 3'-5' helicase n=1 Tax=Candidatus Blautia faecavium TaxID=2838487 RepID=A0A9D2RV28_9FIRM|nr:ATP-dependent helicase [Candidatus Blautia faecavium]